MGQYWVLVNLDKHECVWPHALGAGLKLWEQLASPNPSTGGALVVLCAAMPKPRGYGDFDLTENWHGPERTPGRVPAHNMAPGPMPEGYPAIAARTIGRWAGDRIALVGDYAERGDLPDADAAETIYGRCESAAYPEEKPTGPQPHFRDISPNVCAVIEHELHGSFVGTGWRNFVRKDA